MPAQANENRELEEVVYSNESGLHIGWGEAFRQIWTNLHERRGLIRQYIRRDFVSSYRGTKLGILWKLILALLPMSVYISLHWMGVFRDVRGMPRSLFVVLGMTFWMHFSLTLSITLKRLRSQANLIKRVRMPLVVVYAAGLGNVMFDSLIHLLLSLSLLIGLGMPFSVSWLLLPLMFLPFSFLGIGLGILLSFFAVFTLDVDNIVAVFLRYGLFVSGVIFALPREHKIARVIALNPLYQMIDNSRSVLATGRMPTPWVYACLVVVSVAIFLVALKKTCTMEERLIWAL